LSKHDSRSRLRTILAGKHCVTMATVFDPVSARFAESLGYEAGLVGGSIVSHTVLGAPDVIVLTLTELVEQVRRCTRVSQVPLIIDGDHGYGNALNVMRTVQELDYAGAAAVMIEDTLLPRPFGSSDVPQLLPLDEALGKIKAAVLAREQSDILILGRTSAASLSGLPDALERLRAYEAAGVDALMLPGLRTREALETISNGVRLPLVVGGAAEALWDRHYLASHRVRLSSTGHQPFNVAVEALHGAMKAVLDGTPAPRLAGAASSDLISTATRDSDYKRWIKRFLVPDR
jgi:carboxyvinyl-carboxyphosphonate phosphorylmutase